MIVNEEFLNKLRRAFVLNLYEVKLWTALLSRGVSSAGELSDIADVPRSRTYDVLESLERKGFIIVKPEKPIKYMAIPPTEVLDRVKRRLSESTKGKLKRLSELKDSEIIKELSHLYKQGVEPLQPTDFGGALKGRHNLYDHLAYLVKGAQSQVCIATSEDGILRKVRAIKPLLEKAKGKGVKIRIAVPINDKTKEAVEKLNGVADVKNVKDISARFAIVDGRHVLFMLLDDKDVHPTYDLGMWVHSPYYAQAMQSLFDVAWKKNSK